MLHQKGSPWDLRNPGLSSPARISPVQISPSRVINATSALVRNTSRKLLLSLKYIQSEVWIVIFSAFGNMNKSSFECITFLGEDRTEVSKTRARVFVSTEFNSIGFICQ